MATFAEVFQYLMFAQAGKRAPPQDLGGVPFPAPPLPQKVVSDAVAPTLPIWHFDHAVGSTPAKVTNLTCICRGMGNGRMTVATAITLESAGIKTLQGVDIDLPLTAGFVIQHGYLKKSKLAAGAHFLFPLAAEIDLSMSVVFGYEFKDGPSAKPVKISEAALSSPDFMPQAAVQSSPVAVGGGQRAKVVVAPLRVIVCWSFVTAKERNDFEPGGVLGAGRVWPHAMILANRDIAQASSVTHVERPKALTMVGGDHSKHADMNLTIESGLYADNNTEIQLAVAPLPSPFWDQLFSVYETAVTTGTFRAVDQLEKGGSISGAVKLLNGDGLTYRPATIVRVKGQGAYDNVHVAPTMKSAGAAKNPTFKLDRIYMAPFCEHDCMHTHWRWAEYNTVKSVLGWASKGPDARIPGQPFTMPGAPMVPPNQVVDIEMTSASSYRYRAKAVGIDGVAPNPPIPSGTFSLFFHHGIAYALTVDVVKLNALDVLIDLLAVRNGEPDLPLGETALRFTPIRYWRLRFGGDDNTFSPDVVNERLVVVDRAKVLKRASP